MGLLDWWYEFLPKIVQEQWIGQAKVENIQNYYSIYKKKNNFLNVDFLDVYLPSQPNLLCALTLLCLVSAIFFVVFLLFCVFKRLGACGAAHFNQKPNKGIYRFISITFGFAVTWILLAFLTIILVFCLLDFGTKSFEGVDELGQIHQNLDNNVSPLLHHVRIGINSVTIEDDETTSNTISTVSEQQQLEKYNDIRELGYEFKPLERDSSNFAKYLLVLIIVIAYTVSLVIVGLATVIGVREQLNAYYPMERSTYSDRAGKTLVAISFLLFAISPLVNFLAGVLLIHSHAHSLICPYEQTLNQNSNIEEFINENYKYFEATSLIDFLADLSQERVEINYSTCANFIRPIQGVLFCLLALSWTSLIEVFFMIQISKYFLKKTDSNKLTNWVHPTPQLDAYSNVPDYYGTKSNNSAFTFGTFVYQKY